MLKREMYLSRIRGFYNSDLVNAALDCKMWKVCNIGTNS